MKINQGNPNTLTMAGVTVNLDDSKYFILIAHASAANYDTFQKEDGSKYVVPAGKTLKILAMRLQSIDGATGITLRTATASVSNGPVPAGLATMAPTIFNISVALSSVELPARYSVAQNLYPCIQVATNSGLAVFLCKEV